MIRLNSFVQRHKANPKLYVLLDLICHYSATLEKRWKLPYATVALPLSAALGAFVYVLEKIRPWTSENRVALAAVGMASH
jgi:hypothetical protein